MAQFLTERYRERLVGMLCCYDRIVITGTLPGAERDHRRDDELSQCQLPRHAGRRVVGCLACAREPRAHVSPRPRHSLKQPQRGQPVLPCVCDCLIWVIECRTCHNAICRRPMGHTNATMTPNAALGAGFGA